MNEVQDSMKDNQAGSYGAQPQAPAREEENRIFAEVAPPPPPPAPPLEAPGGARSEKTSRMSIRKKLTLVAGILVLLVAVLVPVLIFTLSDSGGAYKKKAEPVVEQLQKLDSYTDVGINFVDYSKEIRDLKASFDSFTAELSAGEKLKLSYIAMEKAVNAHVSAKSNWQSSIDTDWYWLEDQYKDLMQADWVTASTQTDEAARWLADGK